MTGIDRELQSEIEETSISVEIYDAIYRLRGSDAAYMEQLARIVDGKMQAVADQGGTVDSLRVAVLAALNIADELECLRERHRSLLSTISQTQNTMRSRSASLAGMLDEVLEMELAEDLDAAPIRRAG